MTEVETYSKQITDQSDHEFVVFTTFSASGDQADIEKGNLSIQITDGHRFWRSKGAITAEELSIISSHGRLKPALEALTDKFSSTQKYSYSLDTEDENLFFSIIHHLKTGGESKLRMQLIPVEDQKAAVVATLESLIMNLNRLKKATNELKRGKTALETEVVAIKSLSQEFVATKKERKLVEDKTYQGIAELLNMKKKQLRKAAGKAEPMDVEEENAMDVFEPLQALEEREEEREGGGAAETEETEENEEEEEESEEDYSFNRVQNYSP